jgi:hypothetical protein
VSRAIYLALACSVVLALLASVACGDEGSQPLSTVTPQVSPGVPPFGPTPMPISESDAMWAWIAANAPEVEPVLRPTYLPFNPTLVSAPVLAQQRGCVVFGIEYSDDTGEASLLIGGGPWYNPPIAGPEGLQQELSVRQTTGTYQLSDAADPLGQAFLWWQEPGRWGRPGDDWHRDYVEYLISGEGFPKEEVLKVANGLEPVTQ